jgi:colicin import membrane protein
MAHLKKGGGSKAVGMPGAKGTQAGSDYSAYIQSRLKDAFRDVIASQTGAPQTLVRITIGTDGRITGYRVEKKSGDPVFDDAVSRAVTLAGRYFKPPPGGVPFERVFRFKPEGVGLP